jgi:hypothetical protein
MALLKTEERAFLETVSGINYANPFLAERIRLEREALGPDFDESKANWNLLGDDPEFLQVNTAKIMERAYALITKINEQLRRDIKKATTKEVALYEDAVLFFLYHIYAQKFKQDIVSPEKGQIYGYFDDFLESWDILLDIPGSKLPKKAEAPHIFACFFQLRRAFYYIFRAIIGRSSVAADLRAAVWTSIFTHDMRRYRRSYYLRMGDFTTLIIGPTGSGKELVARAIGLSRYIPFDSQNRRFKKDFFETFFPINLSAMPSTLVESELFGHRRGAFTGAVENRKGWLEVCSAEGSVFVDEIGELDPLVQVKLLRVIQDRTFQPLGSNETRSFEGKIIAATHRDIHGAMAAGDFRKDFYYRLCSDIIKTPSLYQQVSESPEVLTDLVGYIAGRVAGEEGDALVVEVMALINGQLGADYPWPGNIRELEQCVRNVMIRREYQPAGIQATPSKDGTLDALLNGELSLTDVCRWYCRREYLKSGSYVKTALNLKIDRRTVKKYVDEVAASRG